MNRLVAALLAASLAAPALAQQDPNPPSPADAPPPAPSAPAPASAAPAADALEGKVDALAEQLAELKSDVGGLKRLKLSGYLQARWAWQETKDNFYNVTTAAAPLQQNFFVRRGRIKAVYDADWSQYVLQLDATPAGIGIKEGYASIKLPMGFAIDAGLQLFPFGYEVAVRSSADLDLLERAAVTRAYLGGEYDTGVAVKGTLPFAKWVSIKVGLFNGNGIDAKQSGLDNDPLKDVIGRIAYDLGVVTGGFSGWWGKTTDYTAPAGQPAKTYDRQRFGADLQLYQDLLPIGGTAVKGEYLWGKTSISDKNGGAGDLLGKAGHGWYALVTQNVGPWNQVAVRYEQFTRDDTVDVSAPTSATVKTADQVQVALHTFVGGNMKLSVAWFHPMNRKRGDAAPADPKADELVVQAQAKF